MYIEVPIKVYEKDGQPNWDAMGIETPDLGGVYVPNLINLEWISRVEANSESGTNLVLACDDDERCYHSSLSYDEVKERIQLAQYGLL